MIPKNTASLRDILLTAALCGTGGLLLARSSSAADGIRQGISLCLEQAVPSLFLFLILSQIAAASGAAGILARPFGFLGKLLGIPVQGVSVFLFSLIGGYPAGPGMLASMVKTGEISKKTAEKMLCYTVNPSPAYLTAGLSVPCFGSPVPGIMMAGCQALSSLFTGILARIFWGSSHEKKRPSGIRQPFPGIFVQAVADSSKTMLTICGFILTFSVLVRGFQLLPVSGDLAGFLEVTVGCSTLPGRSFREMLILGTVFTAAGGLSVWMQTAAILRGTGISMKKFLLLRGVHLFFSLLFTLIFSRYFSPAQNVFSTISVSIPARGSATIPASFLLLSICLLLLLCTVKCGKIRSDNRR